MANLFKGLALEPAHARLCLAKYIKREIDLRI